MKTSQLILLVFLVSVWTIASCLPVKPLNERSTDLTWQAWLLIDESQNKQEQNSATRKRITPKSVFIAPTFRPESLPECSEGYQSDALGRCIKIIMLNEEAELNFLLQKLNDKFSNQEIDYDYDDPTTNGPLQVNIPLNGEKDETEVAIVVAPSNGLFNESESNLLPTMITEEKVNVSNIAGILGVKQEQVTTSTITSNTPLKMETTTKQVYPETTTTSNRVTTELTASFFMDTTKQVELKNDDLITSSSMVPTEDSTQTEDVRVTTIKREINENVNTATPTSNIEVISQIEPTSQPLVGLNGTNSTNEQVQNVMIPMESVSVDLEMKFGGKTTEYPHEVFLESNMLQNDQAGPELSTKNAQNMTTTKQYTNSTSTATSTTESTIVTDKVENTTSFVQTSTDIINDTEITFSTTEKTTTTSTTSTTTVTDFSTANTLASSTVTAPPEDPTTKSTTSVKKDLENVQVHKRTTFEQNHSINQVIFPDDLKTTDIVKFPTENPLSYYTHLNQISHTDPGSRLAALSNSFMHKGLQGVSVEHQKLKDKEVIDKELLDVLHQRYKAHRENHRNREKHSDWFKLPPKWNVNASKPVVYRFSRKHFINEQNLHGRNFYREVSPGMFGFASRSRKLR